MSRMPVRVFAGRADASKAHGHVVCGHCNASFDSLATLTDQLPPEPFVEMPLNEPALEPPCVDLVVYRPRPEPPVVVVDDESAPADRRRQPGFLATGVHTALRTRTAIATAGAIRQTSAPPIALLRRTALAMGGRVPAAHAAARRATGMGQARRADPQCRRGWLAAQQLRRARLRTSVGRCTATAAPAGQQRAGTSQRRRRADDQCQRAQRRRVRDSPTRY